MPTAGFTWQETSEDGLPAGLGSGLQVSVRDLEPADVCVGCRGAVTKRDCLLVVVLPAGSEAGAEEAREASRSEETRRKIV